MADRLQDLLTRIKQLEDELLAEVQKKEKEYFYEIRHKKIYFEEEIRKQNRQLVKRVRAYLREAPLLNIISVPFIWACLLPALVMDLFVSIYQVVCFPIYAIPKVKRDDYIVIDRHYLSYLNWIEKINCYYCGYFNGLIAYVQEIAARTEQYWCPIKHAKPSRARHSRYAYFLDYGDGSGYRKNNKKVRRDFEDLR
jgi:hypothetical protein